MKKTIQIFSLAVVLALVPAFAFAQDALQNVNKLNAAKLLVEGGRTNLLNVDDSSKENAKTALGILQSVEIETDAENFRIAYLTVCAKANLLLENYDQVLSLWDQAKKGTDPLGEELKYYAACAYFKKGNYTECSALLKNEKPESENKIYYEEKNLLAQSYFMAGNYSEALKLYDLLEENNRLPNDAVLDYARVLYKQKQFKKAYENSSSVENEEAYMISGASCLALKDFSKAASWYEKCGDSSEALYLRSYAQYKSGAYTEAGRGFESYIRSDPQKSASAEAWNYSINSWLMAGNYAKAEAMCVEYISLLQKRGDSANVQKTVLLLGNIYSDQKKYDKAIALYKQHGNTKDGDFSAECMYKTAVCYENSGKIDLSSTTFTSLYDKYPVSANAEESLYRAGEVYYMNGMYKEAAPKFAVYSDNFKKGEYTEQALYYEFDSWIKTGNKAKAILTGNKIINRTPDPLSDGRFQDKVLEEMYNLYYERGDYENALLCARKLSDSNKITFMERILSGENRELVLAQSDYENAGGKATPEGRSKGTVYASLLFKDEETKTQAVKLAGELLDLQEKDIVNEREGAAANALIMAEYFYEQNRKGEAAEKYLKAAEYSRMNGDGEKAAFSLYTAAECFVHLGKKGNAKETADVLQELYPESKYSSAVRSLLK